MKYYSLPTFLETTYLGLYEFASFHDLRASGDGLLELDVLDFAITNSDMVRENLFHQIFDLWADELSMYCPICDRLVQYGDGDDEELCLDSIPEHTADDWVRLVWENPAHQEAVMWFMEDIGGFETTALYMITEGHIYPPGWEELEPEEACNGDSELILGTYELMYRLRTTNDFVEFVSALNESLTAMHHGGEIAKDYIDDDDFYEFICYIRENGLESVYDRSSLRRVMKIRNRLMKPALDEVGTPEE